MFIGLEFHVLCCLVTIAHWAESNRDWKTPDLGLVVFVQQQTGDVLQALAMPLGQ